MSILDKALETFKEANKINYYTFSHLCKEGTLAKILPLTHHIPHTTILSFIQWPFMPCSD